jgi:DNA-binding XRE family transcriptional regulator
MNVNTAQADLHLVGNSVVEAAKILGLDREHLADTIGVSVPTIARIKKGAPVPDHKPYEMALLVIRIYRALYAIVGGNHDAMKHWISTPNRHLGERAGQPAIPAELMRHTEGLIHVLWYLDAMRGKH